MNASPSFKLIQRAAAAAPALAKPGPRPLSRLDGPLSHLLLARNEAELALKRAEVNLDCFLQAVEVINEQANGRLITQTMPPEVREWINRIQARARPETVQRAD